MYRNDQWQDSNKLGECSQGSGLPDKRQGFPEYQMHFFAHTIPDASKL